MVRTPRQLQVLPSLSLLLALAAVPSPGRAASRDLSFPERVAAQEAIERVYHAHRLEAPPFEDAVPVQLLEGKVRRYLLQSAALERYWGIRITAAALQAELVRIGRESQLPDRLQEIYHALGDDPFLVQETFVRQVLVERLTRDFYAFDARFHGEARDEAENARRWMARGRLPVDPSDPRWTVVEIVRRSSPERGPHVVRPNQPEQIVLDADAFAARRGRLPERPGEIGPLVESADGFTVETLLEDSGDRLRLGSYTVPKRSFNEWWDEDASGELEGTQVEAVASQEVLLPQAPEAAGACGGSEQWNNGSLDDIPEPRYAHSVIWTGTEMIVWGGIGTTPYLNSGASYNPLTNAWLPITKINAPAARRQHTAVWTGTEMVVWGGNNGGPMNTGGRYNPTTDSWTSVSLTGAPSAREDHTAVWTGTEMVVWGGVANGFSTFTGGRYNPATNSWTPTTIVGAPAGRNGHVAVWTGTVMVVWAGNSGGSINTGGRYNPATDTWTSTSLVNVPVERVGHTAVWTGTEMVIWGGIRFQDLLDSGGRYNPVTDTWTSMTRLGGPSARRDHTAVWTGTKMIIWGGASGTNLSTGGEWDMATDSWSVTGTGAPSGRSLHGAIWTGSLMVVWGGSQDGNLNTTGGRYDPDTNQWTPTPTANGQSGRKDHTAVWTGSEMIAWGGFNSPPATYLNTGGRYDPVVDSWTPTNLVGAPTGRELHFAVWTGSEMVVWGGYAGMSLNYVTTGGRYDPVSDTWTPTSTTDAPSPRQGPSAAWTGSELIVWGGFSSLTYFKDGFRYDPAADTWTPISQVGAPVERTFHSAVWTGTEMIVWGGTTSLGVVQNGARYDPVSDTWSPMTSVNAPAPRNRHTVVWTGTRMVVWGGYDGVTYRQDGGIYDPAGNTWTAMSLTDAPAGRIDHTAVWDGSEMLVWGGFNNSVFPYLDSGGRFDPVMNSWAPTTLTEAPSPRNDHTAVWIDDRMVIWGGSDGSVLNTGGRYALGDLPPGEATSLRFPDAQTLLWEAASGGGVGHDLARGSASQLPVGSGAAEVCLGQGLGTMAVDASTPAIGEAFWYLPRGVNACGPGIYGEDSFGSLRMTNVCP